MMLGLILPGMFLVLGLVGETALPDAAERVDEAAVRRLLQTGADIHSQQVDGMTALHWTVYHDHRELTQLLLEHGADVKVRNEYGIPPLILSCTNANREITLWLLNRGADPNTEIHGGETALMIASRSGDIGVIDVLLAKGAKPNAKERKGQTAIMWASAEGHAEAVRKLIEAGAEFREPLSSGMTPLLFAVREGKRNVVKVLLDAGADVNQVAVPEKPTGKSVRPGTSPLILAVENGHFELAVDLLERGANPNDLRSGFSPLHTLSWVRKPNRGDGDDGDPAPIGSGNLDSLQFVRELVKHGADVNLRLTEGKSARGKLSRKGATPFFLACVTADAPWMRLLVELGADPFLSNADGSTPLMAAAGLGTHAPTEEAGTEPEVLEALDFLLALGADVNTVDRNGETAMHGAAYKNLPLVVRLLSDRGAKIELWNQKNKWGWTPLLIAEGYRPGNFKPSPETIQAIHQAMLTAGVTPPPPSPRRTRNEDYEKANP